MGNSNNQKIKAERDNTSQQKNPNNDEYWKSRGFEKRPKNWKERIETSKK